MFVCVYARGQQFFIDVCLLKRTNKNLLFFIWFFFFTKKETFTRMKLMQKTVRNFPEFENGL